MSKNSYLHERIKFIRKVLGWTQEKMAFSANVSRVAISQWENKDPEKRTTPDIDKLRSVSDASGFPISWIIEDSSDLEVPPGVEIKNIKSEKKIDKNKNIVVERIKDIAYSIVEISPDGGSDEILVSTLQILSTYRRTLQASNRK